STAALSKFYQPERSKWPCISVYPNAKDQRPIEPTSKPLRIAGSSHYKEGMSVASSNPLRSGHGEICSRDQGITE
ncbi:hypothetical protein KI387_026308, partial [Taxus chinensis]